MKKLLILLPIILIAGCTGMTGYSIINAFNDLPEVQEFAAENPGSNVAFSFLNTTEVNESLAEINSLCGGNVTAGDIYFARISENNAEVNAWFDTDYESLCIIENEGLEEEINETSLSLKSDAVQNGACVKLVWTPYPLSNLKYYKIVKSNSNASPKYPNHATIETIISRLNNSMIYCPDKEGTSYFGVTMISTANETDHTLNHIAQNFNYTNPVEVVMESNDFDLSGEETSQGTCLDLNWTKWPDTIMNYAIYRSTKASDLRNKVQGMMLSIYFNKDMNVFRDCNLNESEIYYRIVARLPDNTTKMSNVFSLDGTEIVGSGTRLEWGIEKACLILNWTMWPDSIEHYKLLKSLTNPLPTVDDPSVTVVNNIATSTRENTEQYDCDVSYSPIYYRVAVVLPNETIEYSNVVGPGV